MEEIKKLFEAAGIEASLTESILNSVEIVIAKRLTEQKEELDKRIKEIEEE